jgi:molybdopterin synthase catalytic subunit
MDTPSTSSASVDATLDIPEGKCVLSYTSINVDEVINSVRDGGAGATAVFIGELQGFDSQSQYV